MVQVPSAIQSLWTSSELTVDIFGNRTDNFRTESLPEKMAGQERTIAQAKGIPIGNWLYQCDNQKAPKRKCTITHQIAEQGRVVFSWQIAIDHSGNMSARWQTVTGVQIARGIILETSGQKPLTLPYSKCVTGYCESAANLNAGFVETLLETERTTATIHNTSGEAVTYTISVDGLAASLRMLGDGKNKI
ncbi:invasion associated locus B family protein [Hoeflea sp. TYP-13]|uniref:invasion associated locus B family protein n=1 Tax=Hoeflea sp. TYP-13 TaxID=3230023 RepID=UPI0034C5C812